MSFTIFSVPEIYVHGALVCYVIGLLIRDELKLRLLILAGTAFYIAYYFQAADIPLWEAILGSAAIAAANIYVIVKILFERSTLGMSATQIEIFHHFNTLTPGLFRRLMKHAKIWTADAPKTLCTEGQKSGKLYLIASGVVIIERGNQSTTIPPGNFIGELGFLLGTPATATVIAPNGAVVIEWDSDRIHKMMRNSPELSNAINAQFNFDIARKLTTSWPQEAA